MTEELPPIVTPRLGLFLCRRASLALDSPTQPCPEAFPVRVPRKRWNHGEGEWHETPEPAWAIELPDLAALMEFVGREGHCIVDDCYFLSDEFNTIVIYDDRVES